jgi:hypothetical protein
MSARHVPVCNYVVGLRSNRRRNRPKGKEEEWKNEADRDDVDSKAVTTEGPAAWWQGRATNTSQDKTTRKTSALARQGSVRRYSIETYPMVTV